MTRPYRLTSCVCAAGRSWPAQVQVRSSLHQEAELVAGPEADRAVLVDHVSGEVGVPGQEVLVNR